MTVPTKILVVDTWSWVYSQNTFTNISIFLAEMGYEVACTAGNYALTACANIFDCFLIKGNTSYRGTLSESSPYGSSGLKLALDLRGQGYAGHIIMATSHHDEPYFKTHSHASGVNALIPKDSKAVLEELRSHFLKL